MAEERYFIPANPVYDEDIRKLQDSDPADACQIFNPLFSRLIENIASIKRQADGTEAEVSSVITLDMTIPTAGWKDSPGEAGEPEGLCIDLPEENIREAMVPILAVLPSCLPVAGACGLSGAVRTLDGALRVYASRPPAQPMEAVLVLTLPAVHMGEDSVASDSDVQEMLEKVFGRRR